MSLFNNWKEEKSSAYLYRLLAAKERGQKQHMFTQLADAAEHQAEIWIAHMQKQGEAIPDAFKPSMRTCIVAWLIKKLAIKQLHQILPAMKIRGLSAYLQAVPGHPMPTSVAEVGLSHKKAGAGGNLRAGVFGANDGLVSNVSLIMGMAGAGASHETILLAGVAGLLAGAFSMAAGEFVSVRSQREMYEYQIALEKEELDLYPEEESAELALIYRARGMPEDEAKKMADIMISNPEHALDVLTREELGLNPEELGSPWKAGLFSFSFFTLGAAIPLLPYFLRAGNGSLLWATGLTIIALFAVGASLSLFTGRKALWGGLRMLLIGGGAGCVTYLIGHILGVTLGG